jgi:hypothetical protein
MTFARFKKTIRALYEGARPRLPLNCSAVGA